MTGTKDRRHIPAAAKTLIRDFERHLIEKSRASAQHRRHRAHDRLTVTLYLTMTGGPLEPSRRRFDARRPGGEAVNRKTHPLICYMHNGFDFTAIAIHPPA